MKPTVDTETGVITDDTEAAADAAENEHGRPEGWIEPTVTADDDVPPPESDTYEIPEQASAPVQLTQKQLEAIGKKIDAAAKRHEDALRAAIGADFEDWLPCPLCMTDGHVLPMQPQERDPGQVQAVLAALGQDGYSELQPARGLEVCDVCDGYGKVRTPSRSPGNEVVNCMECQSRGYKQRIPEPVQTPVAWLPPPPPAPAVSFVPIPGGQPDPYGKPAGHPQWGIDLNAVG